MDNNITFSIVTPVYNNELYIAETIESVIRQSGDFSVEYIIVDNDSTDKTGDIVKSYQQYLQSESYPHNCSNIKIVYISEQDTGMYDAIQKGFSRASGDIYAWLNSDDIYLNGCFNLMAKVFTTYSDLKWVKGITSYINKDSAIYSMGRCHLYSREWITEGLYGPVLTFIQQDSVFWRKELWDISGGVNKNYKLAGDFDLWRNFAKYAPLCSINAYVSCFRKVENQMSENIDKYWKEIEDINEIILSKQKLGKKIRKQERNKNGNLIYKMFSSVFKHRYYLITVTVDGAIELHVGKYEDLQSIL